MAFQQTTGLKIGLTAGLPAFLKHTSSDRMNKNIFFVGLILAARGLFSPPFALMGGLGYGFALTNPFHAESKRLAKFLLQASVVALGFGMRNELRVPATIAYNVQRQGNVAAGRNPDTAHANKSYSP